MEMPKRDRSLMIAATVTLLAHAGLAVWLLQLQDEASPARAGRALEVVWLDPPPLPLQSPRPDRKAATVTPQSPAHATRPPASTALQAVELPARSPTDASAPMTSLQEQARQFARGQLPADTFERDLLRHRPAARADGRFAMPEPISAEDVVIAIGQLFGGGPTDPCPRIRNNLANADMGTGRELAEEELRRLRRNCL